PLVPGPGRGAGVRAACRDGLPGHDRELQRLVANPGLVAFSAPRPGRLAAAVAAPRGGVAAAPGRAGRSRTRPAGLPRGLEVPATQGAGWPAGFPQAEQWPERGAAVGSHLGAAGGLASSLGPG